jgi:hypothetical protein
VNKRARAARVESLYAVVVRRGGQARIGHVFDLGPSLQPSGDAFGVADVALHSQAQRLDAEQRLERGGRGHGHAEVAQAHGDAVKGEGHGAEGLVELQPV